MFKEKPLAKNEWFFVKLRFIGEKLQSKKGSLLKKLRKTFKCWGLIEVAQIVPTSWN